MNFGQAYRGILENVMSMGHVERNHRTNTVIREMPEGASLLMYLNMGILPTCGLRKTKPWHAAAEAAWCLLGHDHIRWLQKHSHVWDKFAEPDGGLLQAYGHRWKDTFGVNQLQAAIARFERDKTDRRVWITSYDPHEDLVDSGQKTVPCPVGFSLAIMNDGLCSTLMIRSSDLYFGLPYDVMRHALIMNAIATTLGIGLGYMRVTLAHPHVYKPQWNIVNEMLQEVIVVCPRVLMPKWSMEQITTDPDGYVEAVKEECNRPHHHWPEFDPKSEVVK